MLYLRSRDFSIHFLLLLSWSAVNFSVGKQKRQVLLQEPAEFRVWLDEKKFKRGETVLVRDAFLDAGALHTGGPAKDSSAEVTLGYQVPDRWDILWTTPTPGKLALPYLAAWQAVNLMPGLTAITRKDSLASSVLGAFGEASHGFLPPSFLLPRDLGSWRRWRDSAGCGGPPERRCLWVLKANKHLGKGIAVLPREEAEREATAPDRKYVLAQKYVGNPLLVNGRKFGIRLWVVMTSARPLRGYVHERGLVLFSSEEYSASAPNGSTAGHLTNAFQNAEGVVWALEDLRAHLGDAFGALWESLRRISGLVLAAAVDECRRAAAAVKLRPGSGFQLLGLDFLIGADLRAWLIEANGTPSMSLYGADKVGTDVLRREKATMLRDLVRLIGVDRSVRGREARSREQECSWDEGAGWDGGQCGPSAQQDDLPSALAALADQASAEPGAEGRTGADPSVQVKPPARRHLYAAGAPRRCLDPLRALAEERDCGLRTRPLPIGCAHPCIPLASSHANER